MVKLYSFEYCAEDMNTLQSDCELKEKICIQNHVSFVLVENQSFNDFSKNSLINHCLTK